VKHIILASMLMAGCGTTETINELHTDWCVFCFRTHYIEELRHEKVSAPVKERIKDAIIE